MTEIAALERRIATALDRIGKAATQLRHPPPAHEVESAPESDADALQQALEAEREANAQLSERVSILRQRQETTVAQLERRLARMTEQLDLQRLEMLRLKKANSRMADTNAALRAAQTGGAPDSPLLNRSLSAELEALQADRRAEMAEMEEILTELKALLDAEERDA